MRIISGTHRGRKIDPPNNLPVRPTTDKAKEALFNIIDNRYYFEGKTALDLFSGTGNIAFEFASRGAKEVIAIDNNINCIKFIKATANDLKLDINPIQSDGLEFTKNCRHKFNFIFADPPYNYQEYKKIKNLIIKKNLIKKDGVLIIEHDKNTIFKESNIEVRRYGTVHFSIFSF